uniref:Uncharacterized protein n=1 Tax=Priestia megaterium (strain ATCC 12872 / QMB1551) TaxID=545693 RepID=D5E3C8_PRIM1|nr:hypothetical protein BMQ_pBM40004 [Priestia megaterium QM B1551]
MLNPRSRNFPVPLAICTCLWLLVTPSCNFLSSFLNCFSIQWKQFL